MSDGRIGIIAGDGNLPKILIETIKNPFVVGISGFFDETDVACEYTINSLEKFGGILNSFKDANVEKIVMAGGVGSLDINKFTPADTETENLIKTIIQNGAIGDDTVLRTVIEYINSQGFEVIGVEDIIGQQLIPVGCLTKAQPSEQNNIDIEIGKAELNKISDLDIAQAVVVEKGEVLSVEDEKGTDALINKSGGEKQQVLVKGKKQNQTRLADLPVIGLKTVEAVASNGFSGIAVFSCGTIILNKDAVIKKADELGIFIVSI